MGEQAKSAITSNIKNTITGIKKVLGKRYQSADVQAELPFALYGIRDVAGEAQVTFSYNDETHTWRVERVMAMLLGQLRKIGVDNNEGKPIADCVIAIPPYWTDSERNAMLQACQIVGLNVLKLMHDSTAAALSYGIVRTDLPEEKDAHNVLIFDLGHGDVTASIVTFSKGKLVVKAVASDTVGCRDLDMLVAKHCAELWKEKHKIDAFTNPKATFRLLQGCEKLRKTLSTIPQSNLSIECFMEDIDVTAQIKREDFNEWAQPWLERVMGTVERALASSGLDKSALYSCEAIGGGSRIPCVAQAIKQWMGRDPGRHLNADEAVARGCALQAAMLSPAFRVREFSINEVTVYPVMLSWANVAGDQMETDDAAAAEAASGEGAIDAGKKPGGSEIFSRFNPLPSTKMLTLNRNSSFMLTASYDAGAGVPTGTPPLIAEFTIAAPPAKDGKDMKCKVKVRLDLHGMVVVESAFAVEEHQIEVEVDEPAPAAAAEAPAVEGAPAAAPTPPPMVKVKKTKTKTEKHSLEIKVRSRPASPQAGDRRGGRMAWGEECAPGIIGTCVEREALSLKQALPHI